ncbi:hypothetical protein QTH04_12150 [Clostridium perfringens]|nr:hypothetical protein [Clostridium perfringens]MDM0452373.1 hypothetical protein [Clostridium perfringens]
MLKEIIFGISSIKGPTWLKEFNENNKQLEDLKILSGKVYAFGKNTRDFNHGMNCHDVC